ncbi:protein-serine/threonine phosphatase [Malassezia sp. CBS 17886]|nr:protein-serine/threonine phosphatase [Malassezia sp. CBS 17886]
MFGPIADFLIGGAWSMPATRKRAEPEKTSEPELPSRFAWMEGRGLNSAIRDEGRIVQTRLHSKQDALGISDGVGGWASSERADPALFSRLLMHFCWAELRSIDDAYRRAQQPPDDEEAHAIDAAWQHTDPVDILQTAWERSVRASKREGIMGSATALLAVLRGDELRVANMGDCVLMLIRDGRMVFRSTEQQHSFNFPVQLGMMDATVESVSLASALCLHRDGTIPDGANDDELPGGKQIGDYLSEHAATPGKTSWDSPRMDAGHWTFDVQPGDVLILASDGLHDNLFDEDIIEQLGDVLAHHASCPSDEHSSAIDLPYAISRSLCERAREASTDGRLLSSPFQQHANEEGIYYVGGKNDDITVITAVVAAAGDDPGGAGLGSRVIGTGDGGLWDVGGAGAM